MAPEENAYELLGLQGPAATDAEIKKAYRKQALLKHPDKNPDNPNAANEFAALQRAYDLLLDPQARAALDGLLKAREIRVERSAAHDDKRRRMMQDLERRERASGQGRSQEEVARAKLQTEIERLRRAAAERERSAARERSGFPVHSGAQQQMQTGGGAREEAAALQRAAAGMQQKLARTLKVSWARRDGEYDAPQLREIFVRCGVVEDVVVRDGKRKKGSALVVMATLEGAAAAAGDVHGDLSNPLLVTLLAKATVDGDDDDLNLFHQPAPPAQPVPSPEAAGTRGFPAKPSAGLGAKPAAPLFGAGLGRAALPAQPAAALFPAAAVASVGGGPRMGPPASAPLFAAAGAARNGAYLSGFASFTAPPPVNGGGPFNRGYEDDTLAQLRQAAERRRALAALQRQEQGEEAREEGRGAPEAAQ